MLKLRVDGTGDDMHADVLDMATDNHDPICDVCITGDADYDRDVRLPLIQKMVDNHNLAELARHVYITAYDNTESFMLRSIGAGVAYLMGAILQNDKYMILDGGDEHEQEFVEFLRETFADTDPLWNHIEFEQRPVADRITQLRTELEAERISQGELCEIEALAEQAGITITPEMMASDMLDEIEKAHATPDRKSHDVTLSNGQVLTIEEGEDEIHLLSDMYICRIDASGVLVMPNSGDATHSLTSGL